MLAAVPELAAEGCVVAVVPGPNDPGTCGALPRPPIPAYFASRLTTGAAAGLPAVALMSNPCRIRYYTQEILFARADITSRLRKRAILSPVPHDAEHAEHVRGAAAVVARERRARRRHLARARPRAPLAARRRCTRWCGRRTWRRCR